MNIRQVSLVYQVEADRLLLRVNTGDAAQFALWFTRRLALRLWPHLAQVVTTIGVQQVVAQASPDATVLPEARAMLADAARERAMKNSDLKTPFDETVASQPLGAEPMLVTKAQLTPLAGGALRMVFFDAAQRHITIQLGAEHATVVRELMKQALVAADWGLAFETAAPAAVAPAQLN